MKIRMARLADQGEVSAAGEMKDLLSAADYQKYIRRIAPFTTLYRSL